MITGGLTLCINCFLMVYYKTSIHTFVATIYNTQDIGHFVLYRYTYMDYYN